MNLVEKIKAKAKSDIRRIVLPEGDEPRTVKAAEAIRAEGIADPILVTPETIAADAPRLERCARRRESPKRRRRSLQPTRCTTE